MKYFRCIRNRLIGKCVAVLVKTLGTILFLNIKKLLWRSFNARQDNDNQFVENKTLTICQLPMAIVLMTASLKVLFEL